jgi:tripartite-type tricarboxylate transporter receptor subunit TctC
MPDALALGRRALGDLAGLLAGPAAAQEAWSTGSIRLVVAFTAGGKPDLLARAIVSSMPGVRPS